MRGFRFPYRLKAGVFANAALGYEDNIVSISCDNWLCFASEEVAR